MLLRFFKPIHLAAIKIVVIVGLCVFTTGCVGTVVGAVVDTAVEVIKVPFKVGGAVIDAVTPDDDFLPNDSDNSEPVNEEDAIQMEQENL